MLAFEIFMDKKGEGVEFENLINFLYTVNEKWIL